jgi:hypothetical protein
MIIRAGMMRPIPAIPIKATKIFAISIMRSSPALVAISIEDLEDMNIIEVSPKKEPERVTQAATPRRCMTICVKMGRNCSAATNLSNRGGRRKGECAHKSLGEEQAGFCQPESDSEPHGRAGEGPISPPLVRRR